MGQAHNDTGQSVCLCCDYHAESLYSVSLIQSDLIWFNESGGGTQVKYLRLLDFHMTHTGCISTVSTMLISTGAEIIQECLEASESPGQFILAVRVCGRARVP